MNRPEFRQISFVEPLALYDAVIGTAQGLQRCLYNQQRRN
jgi:hypothetical protein